ncbi:P-loop containing nucleoside triphosphate hydrolase protein [Mycena floridula]|nr:P-loop containing nucleoside triphosphate hydrolase protein [Mycena floridula]
MRMFRCLQAFKSRGQGSTSSSHPIMSSATSSDESDNVPMEGIGLSNPQLSRNQRRTLDVVNCLHSTGLVHAFQVDIDLPQIVALGSQSAGKSSAIESISGITLPRASGTCTRCPTECRLTRSDEPWKCITLGQVRNESFGGVIYDKAAVEDRIRRAQRAILNPSTPASKFLSGDDEDPASPELTFAPKYISLQISGPDVADLSFCDLSGLIASGNETDIKLIRSLVASYISKPSCVILLTVACETDFQNQGAQQLAKEYDPLGKRTIGMYSDRRTTYDEETWLSLIRNEEEPLESITWEQARSRENSFFLSTSPWNKLDPMYQNYLRTSNLLLRLSKVLSDLIAKRLPEIKHELDGFIDKAQSSLRALPREPSKEPLYDIANLLSEFSNDLAVHTHGIPRKHGLLQQIRGPQERFRKAIQSTAPDFRPYEYEGSDEAQANDEEVEYRPIYIDEVMARVSESRSRELPGNYPYIVHVEFIADCVSRWKAPAMRLSREVHALALKHADTLIKKHFNAFEQGTLEQRVRVLIQERLDERLLSNEKEIERLIKLESQPFTLNTHYLADYKDKFMAQYKGHRKANMGVMKVLESYPKISKDHLNAILSYLGVIGIGGVKAVDLAQLLPSDAMTPALNIMAEVRAYFQVAYKRFADNVPLAIDLDLVRGVEKDVLRALQIGLKIYGKNGSEICKELAEESPQVAERRLELVKKLERLREARKELLEAMI